MSMFDVLLEVLGAVGDIVAAGGKCTKEDSKLQGTEYEQLGSDLERSGNDFANNMRKLKRTFGDDDDEYDDCSLPSKTQKSDTQNTKNRSDLSDLRKPERFFLCNIIF